MKINFRKEIGECLNNVSFGVSFRWGSLGTSCNDPRRQMIFNISLSFIKTYTISLSWFGLTNEKYHSKYRC